jgi:hypothetical protein
MVLSKLTMAFNVCGAMLAVPAGVIGLYTTYQANFSGEAACRGLRNSLLTTLEKNVDAEAKRVLVQKDLATFEHACALSDPDAKSVFESVDRNILFADKGDAGHANSSPVTFRPLPWLFHHGWRGRGDMGPPPPARWPDRPFGT